jgi:predicted PurR-regulated permease PerM
MRRMPPRPQPEPVADKRTVDRRQGNARILIGTIIVIAVLHLARPVVVPVALAVLFAFLSRRSSSAWSARSSDARLRSS